MNPAVAAIELQIAIDGCERERENGTRSPQLRHFLDVDGVRGPDSILFPP
jgi:hypothetical protein